MYWYTDVTHIGGCEESVGLMIIGSGEGKKYMGIVVDTDGA